MCNFSFLGRESAGFVMAGSGVCLEACKCTLSHDLIPSASVVLLVVYSFAFLNGRVALSHFIKMLRLVLCITFPP